MTQPEKPTPLNYSQPPKTKKGLVENIVFGLLTGILALPVGLSTFMAFAFALGDSEYPQLTGLIVGIILVILVFFLLIKKVRLRTVLALLLCVIALGFLAFGICSTEKIEI